MNFQTRLFVGALAVWVLDIPGCAARQRLTYNVTVANASKASFYDVKVQYDDGTWDFVFGVLSPGKDKSATYVGANNMPPIPKTATVIWRDESGTYNSVVTKMPESVRGVRNIQHGDLEIAIESRDSVEATFLD